MMHSISELGGVLQGDETAAHGAEAPLSRALPTAS